MEYDDKVRSKFGVTVCLRDMGNGSSRLFFDDVRADGETNPIAWQYNSFYTFTPELQNATIDEMKLSDTEFQQIGVAVVARLLASNGRAK